MRFSVMWLADATEELVELWSDAGIRQSVVAGARRIETVLSLNPQEAGESRPENLRIHFESPLAVIYEVFLAERRVDILQVRYYAKR